MADENASLENDLDYTESNDADALDRDDDSTMGDSIASSTVSMTPSIARYEHHHGRRYHAYQAGRYFMPNDEEEQVLMDLTQHISLAVHDGQLFLAPIKMPTSILDIGTGTGSWAFDVADMFPGAFVIGTDLSPIQPHWVPINLQFEVSDCEDDWSFSTKFDLIHTRNLSGSITDWPRLIRQIHQFLKHEGWFDTANVDVWFHSNNDTLPEDSALSQWRNLLAEAYIKAGRNPDSARRIKQHMMENGFVSVTEEIFKLPLSPWMHDPKMAQIARLMQYLMERELEGMSLALFTRILQWSVEDLRKLLNRVRAEMSNFEYEIYCNVYCVYGQKPAEGMDDPVPT